MREALSVLEGATEPNSLIQKSLSISGIALEMAGKAAYGQGFDMAAELLRSGKALEKMRQIIEIQGGDPMVKAEDIVPGEYCFDVRAPHDGYVIELNNRALVTLARLAGSPYDHGAGLDIHAKKGTRVKKGDPIFTIYADREWRLERTIEVGRTLMPVLVEGMVFERVPAERWM